MGKDFFNPLNPDNSAQIAAIQQWFALFWAKKTDGYWGGAISDENLHIETQHCGESGCLYSETLLTFREKIENEVEKIHYFRIKKPLVFIRKYDFTELQSVESPHAGAHKHG
ncbi:MAG: hypothetical protein RL757_2358 [Bacteroidota bacterium]|jgi:hypothetical protein